MGRCKWRWNRASLGMSPSVDSRLYKSGWRCKCELSHSSTNDHWVGGGGANCKWRWVSHNELRLEPGHVQDVVKPSKPNDGCRSPGDTCGGICHVTSADKGNIPPMVGDTMPAEDVPLWCKHSLGEALLDMLHFWGSHNGCGGCYKHTPVSLCQCLPVTGCSYWANVTRASTKNHAVWHRRPVSQCWATRNMTHNQNPIIASGHEDAPFFPAGKSKGQC